MTEATMFNNQPPSLSEPKRKREPVSLSEPNGPRKPKSESDTNERKGQTRILPLWKTCVENMLASGVTYGSNYEVEFFEEQLAEKRDTPRFGFSVSKVRLELEKRGMYLRGSGGLFIILPASQNVDVMTKHARVAHRRQTRAVILGEATDTQVLSKSQLEKHKRLLERNRIRLLMLIEAEKALKSQASKVNQNKLASQGTGDNQMRQASQPAGDNQK